MDSVVTGPYLLAQAEGFPRHYPPSVASFLIEAAGVGFAVMSGIYPQDRSRGGQVGFLPDKEFRYLRQCCYSPLRGAGGQVISA